MRVITDESDFEIQPHHIDASDHLWASFGNSETEVSAGWIVRFLQDRGEGWKAFRLEDLQEFYSRRHSNGFSFNQLVSKSYITRGNDGMFRVTDEFINRCYRSRPAPQA